MMCTTHTRRSAFVGDDGDGLVPPLEEEEREKGAFIQIASLTLD